MSIGELVHALNSRSKFSLFRIGFFSNKRMNTAFAVCMLLQLGVVMIPQVASVFSVVTHAFSQWLVVAALGFALLTAVEISKRVKS